MEQNSDENTSEENMPVNIDEPLIINDFADKPAQDAYFRSIHKRIGTRTHDFTHKKSGILAWKVLYEKSIQIFLPLVLENNLYLPHLPILTEDAGERRLYDILSRNY